MPEPKKQSSPRKTGMRRSHLRLSLARKVNKKSPVKAFETKKKTPRLRMKDLEKKAAKALKKAGTKVKEVEKKVTKDIKKVVPKKPTAKKK